MLTESQQRTLEIGLRRVETELAWVEALLGWTYEGLLVSFIEDLEDSKRQELLTQIREARELIHELEETFGLRPDRVPKSSWLVGRLAHLWVIAEECQSRYLRGYGEVSPDLPAQLDPVARRLAEILLAMQRLARESRSAEPIGGSP